MLTLGVLQEQMHAERYTLSHSFFLVHTRFTAGSEGQKYF